MLIGKVVNTCKLNILDTWCFIFAQTSLVCYLFTTIGTGSAKINTPMRAQNPPMIWKRVRCEEGAPNKAGGKLRVMKRIIKIFLLSLKVTPKCKKMLFIFMKLKRFKEDRTVIRNSSLLNVRNISCKKNGESRRSYLASEGVGCPGSITHSGEDH